MSLKILVVDDDAHSRAIYREWLREIRDVEIMEAASGRAALQLIHQHAFALFVVDVDMPEMDGYELASQLRQQLRDQAAPIILVTAAPTDRQQGLRAYRMGAIDCVVGAPANGEVVLHKARTLVEAARQQAALREALAQARKQNEELQQRLEQIKQQHEELRTQATHDPLTHLPNRALFRDRVWAARARATRNRQLLVLGYLDLDGFKAVNDRYGHAAGDALLAAVGERLSHGLRATDTVSRLGGDEFGLVLEALDSPLGARHVADKLHRSLAAPFRLRPDAQAPEIDVTIGASIGLALYPEHATDVDGLILMADVAMYAAKNDGGGVRIYAADLEDMALPGKARLRLVRDRQNIQH